MATTTIKERMMPKPYLLEVLQDYMEVENGIGDIIKSSGYRNQYIAQKLNLPLSTFYLKKKSKTFTTKEVAKIVRMLDDDTEDNAAMLALAKERMLEEDDETMTADNLIQMLRK